MQQKTIETDRKGQFADWAAIIFALALPTIVTLLYFVWAEEFAPAVQQGSYAVGKTVQFCFPLVWVCLVCKRRPKVWPWTARGIGTGIVFGLTVAGAMIALYHGWLKTSDLYAKVEEAAKQKVTGMEIGPGMYIAVAVFYSLIHSLLEEYYFRWFVFGQLKLFVRFWLAGLISSLGFMAHHVLVLGKFFGYASLTTWLFSLAIAIGGMAWAWLYERSGSLLGPWVSHLIVDAAIFAIGYEIIQNLPAA